MSKSVLIIGCGIAGLATLKECLAEGLNVKCVEARDSCGGQWYYEDVNLSPSPVSPSSSMYQSVIIQSPRDMMSFSDFPMDPSRYPYFASHKQVLQYLREYADFYDLWPHIQFSTEVVKVQQEDDGKWKTWMWRKDGSNAVIEAFDAVFVCSGRHSKPHIPDFKDHDRYQGLFLHSHLYRTPDLFAGKKVAIIGLGNTAGDVAVELSKVSKVHLITRRGAWIVPRTLHGRPTEHLNSRLSQAIVPKWLSRFMQKKLFKEALGDIPSELVPEHEIGRGNPVINDDFLEQVRNELVRVHHAEVEKFTVGGIELSDGTQVEADVIIACTGYQIDYPFLPRDVWKPIQHHQSSYDSSNRIDLYRVLVPLQNTNMFFPGIFHAFGPFPPIVELQARWANAVLSGRINLPTKSKMEEEIRKRHQWNSEQFVHSDRHVNNLLMVPYCDELASDLDVLPSLSRLLGRVLRAPLTGLRVLIAYYTRAPLASHYRLFGHGNRKHLAEESIMRAAVDGSNLSFGEQLELSRLKSLTKKQL